MDESLHTAVAEVLLVCVQMEVQARSRQGHQHPGASGRAACQNCCLHFRRSLEAGPLMPKPQNKKHGPRLGAEETTAEERNPMEGTRSLCARLYASHQDVKGTMLS